MEEMTIKRSEVGCGIEHPWEGRVAIILSGENQQIFVGGWGLGKKLQFAAGKSNTIFCLVAHLFNTTIKQG